MITRLTQYYKITCDRCGKTDYCDELTKHDIDHGEVRFATETKTLKMGGICGECFKAFVELAEIFFDDVNQGST